MNYLPSVRRTRTLTSVAALSAAMFCACSQDNGGDSSATGVSASGDVSGGSTTGGEQPAATSTGGGQMATSNGVSSGPGQGDGQPGGAAGASSSGDDDATSAAGAPGVTSSGPSGSEQGMPADGAGGASPEASGDGAGGGAQQGGAGGAGGATNPSESGAGGTGGTGETDEGEARDRGEANALVPNPIVTHVFTADPSAYVFEGRIYIYASHDPDDQMAYDMVDYHVFSSNDLANWQDHGVVLAAADISFATKLYAPDCAYDAELDKYFLYFPDAGSTIGVAVSDDPGGPFENPVQLVTSQTPGVSDVDWLFDPSAFFDDDGQGYLYFGGGPPDTGDNARVIRLNPDRVSLMDASATTIVVPDFFEASFMTKRDGKYYFSYSTTFENHAPTIDYMVSDDPMTGFEHVGTVIPNPEGNNGDNNHHSLVEYEGQWYVFYHNRVLANREGYSNYQRSITLDEMTWDDAGNMNEVPATRGDVRQLRSVDAFERIEAELLAGQGGIETDFAVEGGARVGVAVTDIREGDWIAVSQVDFADGANTLHLRVASVGGGMIDVLQGGCEGFRDDPGTIIGSCEIGPLEEEQSWADVSCAVEAAAGVHDLCLRFSGAGEQIMDLDYYYFE